MFDEETRARLIELGRRLKQRREDKGLSLQDLDTLSGVHTSYIGRIERGERRPGAEILRKLAEPLGFTETELLKLAGYLSPDQVDERIEIFKEALKTEITVTMANLLEKVDSL